jgi:hypothetical protein
LYNPIAILIGFVEKGVRKWRKEENGTVGFVRTKSTRSIIEMTGY